MAPVTPSPHRFLSGRERQQQAPTAENLPQSLRRQTGAPTQGIAQQTTPVAAAAAATSTQFAPTPRFSTGRPAQPRQSTLLRSPDRRGLAQSLRPSTNAREDVEEAETPKSEDEEMLDTEPSGSLPTIENTFPPSNGPEWTEDLPYSPKRRKLDHFNNDIRFLAAGTSPARTTFRHSTAPVSQIAPTSTPFVRTTASNDRNDDDGNAQHRPAFLLSSIGPPEQTSEQPLPETFSPHRRGRKFMPGGMAGTLQQWVIETGQAAVQSRRGQAYLRGDVFVLRIKIDEISGHGPFLSRGTRLDDAAAVRILLMAKVDSSGIMESSVSVGSVVGIRAPVLTVALGDESDWNVAVDWKVLP